MKHPADETGEKGSPHPIKEWLAKQSPRRTMIWLADQCRVHPITLRRMMNADDTTQRDLFEKIEVATGGELTAVDLYAHYLAQRGGASPPPAAMAPATT